MTIASTQRFAAARPCPICGGQDGAPRGQGARCWGYLSIDGRYAHCTRPEHAGSIELGRDQTYAHRLDAPCRCGVAHTTVGIARTATGQIPNKRVVVARYAYHDDRGTLLYEVERLEPKGFRVRRSDGRGGWIYNMRGIHPVLYRLPELVAAAADALVWIVEGEKDADRLAALGLIATTNIFGAGKWRPEYAPHLRGRRVFIIEDNDDPGKRHAAQVACSLHDVASSVKVVALPGLSEHGDVSDWLDASHTKDELIQIADSAPEPTTRRHGTGACRSNGRGPGGNGAGSVTPVTLVVDENASQAQKIVVLAQDAGVELFMDRTQQPWVTFPVDDHSETWRVTSQVFARWLRCRFAQQCAKVASSEAVSNAIQELAAIAQFSGHVHDVHIRFAEYHGRVYLDLADKCWRAVELDATGWRIADTPPVKFHHPRGTLPLPEPVTGGTLEALGAYVNVTDDGWPLLIGWIFGAISPSGPYPALLLTGPQGSAKSTSARILTKLIDPRIVEGRAEPKDLGDLAVAAANTHLLCYDNISHIPGWLSDALCRLATGGGSSKRQLYTDVDEVLLEACRPVAITSITDTTATRPDLLDRAIILELDMIPDTARRPERELYHAFDADRPAILGALLDAVCTAIRNRDAAQMTTLPRMADFARWVIAGAPALGIDPAAFIAAYSDNRADANSTLLDNNLVAQALFVLLDDHNPWEGTTAVLLSELSERVDERVRKLDIWPQTPQAMRSALQRLTASLAVAAVQVTKLPRRGRARPIRIERTQRTPIQQDERAEK